MAARGSRNNLVAKRVIDDLIDISEETSTNLISQLNALIAELEASGDYKEVFDLMMELQDERHDDQDKVADFNRLIVVVEEKIHSKEIDLEMLEAEGNDVAVGCAIGIMETQAIDDQDHLVNYDNDNENDDLGYQLEGYFDEADKEDGNNHSNGNVVKRGITRLYKFCREYGKPDGIKLSVTFDALNRISRKYRALFSSFLGDMVHEHIGLKILSWKKVDSEERDKLWDEITRYFDVDLTVRKLVMNRPGQLLRSFRRKLRQTYILPNQNTLYKLNEVPAKYSAILKAEEWVNFVKYTATDEYKVKSAATKMACSKTVYPHIMGRGGYTRVKENMIEKKEIEPDEEPTRGTLWLKGGVNKDGEYPDDEIRSVGDKLKETEDKIKEGTLKVDHGTDSMTIVLGKEKGGYARGVGSGVTYKRYFDLPRSRQASDERILFLQSQLDNERRERQEKELLIQNLSNKMSQIEGMVTKLKNQLAAQGGQFQSILTRLTPPNVSPVDINPINSSADEEGGTTVVGFENDASIQKSNGLATLEKEIETRVTCIPDVGSNGFKTVKDAVGGFFAWPKDQVILDPEATPPSTIQMNVENKIASKIQTKCKNIYVSSDAMQRQAKKKSLQKSLNY
ncbi:transposase, Ptta/En/Spm, transposase, Tnp1/En/Spm-like protein [Tanacetum coccineum]